MLTLTQIITTDPNPDVKKQIVRELNFNKDCASHHICRYYGAFMDKSTGTISIAMEFCEGGSLDSIYKEVKKLGGRTGEKVLGKVAEGVLNGLTYLHSRKIIHRGMKHQVSAYVHMDANYLQTSNPPTFSSVATAK
jgi:mitogen-activated protein kinase kinase